MVIDLTKETPKKRKLNTVVVNKEKEVKRPRLDEGKEFCPIVSSKTDMKGTHITLISNIGEMNSDEISVPKCLLEQLNYVVSSIGSCKIQFIISIEFEKEGIISSSNISNKAVTYNEEFIKTGIEKLNEKLSVYLERGSGWRITRILEISFTIIKTSEISRLSGSTYIPYSRRICIYHIQR